MNLTQKEKNIIEYLANKSVVYWEELAQFSQNPQQVKLKTIQKSVNNIIKKYKNQEQLAPFKCEFKHLSSKTPNGSSEKLVNVQIKNGVVVPKIPTPKEKISLKPCQSDFQLDKNRRMIQTKYGFFQLNENEWEIFKFFWERPEEIITLENLKNLVYPNFGSKIPPRWFDSIGRRINNLRNQVQSLKTRLITVRYDNGTGYIFK